MEEVDKALDDLIQLAKPPSRLAPPESFLQDCIDLHLSVWKRNVLAHLKPAFTETRRSSQTLKDISYRNFAQEVRAYNEWLWSSVEKNRALHYDVYVALLATQFSQFCRPIHPSTPRPPVAAQPGPQHPTENHKLLRRRLNTAFEKAAIAAASNNRESVTRGDLPARILHQEPLLKEWAEAGIEKVDKMSDEQLDVAWVYGMLELLKCLTIACDAMQLADADKTARKDFLLHHWTVSALFERCPFDGRKLPAALAYVHFTICEHEHERLRFDAGPVPVPQHAQPATPHSPGFRNRWSRVSVSRLFGRQRSHTVPSTGQAAPDPSGRPGSPHGPRRSYQAVITAAHPHRGHYSFA